MNLKSYSFETMKILNTKESILISTPSNTDGIINKLVAVFELCLLPGPVANRHPDSLFCM